MRIRGAEPGSRSGMRIAHEFIGFATGGKLARTIGIVMAVIVANRVDHTA